MADLITLAEFKVSQGIDPLDTRDDPRNTQWISFVSDAIRAYTERDFGVTVVTEQRTFEYDGSGYLDIDDASAVTDVTFTYPLSADIVIPATDWAAKPQRRDDAPMYYYILMVGGYGVNPAMGFMRNLDVWCAEHCFSPPPLIKVTGTWGWSSVPGVVKMAAILTMQEWIERPSGEGLTSEAIEGWSRSWSGKGNNAAAAVAIPQRARDLLAAYDKGI